MNSTASQIRASYDALKKEFIKARCTSYALEELKNHFHADIASRRLQERICTVAELVAILEKRDLISENDVTMLHLVADYCLNKEIKDYINAYIPPDDQKFTYENEYRDVRIAESLRERLHLQANCNNFGSEGAFGQTNQQQSVTPAITSTANVFSAEKKVQVYKRLSKELGSYWRTFGRELDVSEGDMDNIELQFPRDLPSRVYKLMELFEDDASHDPKRHVLIICRALDSCRRKDLRRKVEEIMAY